jgi:hypothetical protein
MAALAIANCLIALKSNRRFSNARVLFDQFR